MKPAVEIGMNRTGIGMSPMDSQDLIDNAASALPSMAGDGASIAEMRDDYAKTGEPIGTVPPPMTVAGVINAVMESIKGDSMASFIDKLGERLAFERTGTRLYDAFITKCAGIDDEDMIPDIDLGVLQRFRDEEKEHFDMLRAAIEELGGDPTVVTPSADVASVTSLGVIQVLGDPRTSVAQCVQAMLVAELTDGDGWALLVEMAEDIGKEDLVESFQRAFLEEERHLEHMRAWNAAAVTGRDILPDGALDLDD
ncbi:MAG: ferritin-like protein [Myxococcaceae bacterium]|nr:ferritin-like protein [Myxococcaceae bacterium]